MNASLQAKWKEIFLAVWITDEEVEGDDDDDEIRVAKCKGDEGHDHPPIGGVI